MADLQNFFCLKSMMVNRQLVYRYGYGDRPGVDTNRAGFYGFRTKCSIHWETGGLSGFCGHNLLSSGRMKLRSPVKSGLLSIRAGLSSGNARRQADITVL